MIFSYIELCRDELCRDNLVDKTECFGTSWNVRVENGIRFSRLKTQFAVIMVEAKHEGDRTYVNIPVYDVYNVTRSIQPPSIFTQ